MKTPFSSIELFQTIEFKIQTHDHFVLLNTTPLVSFEQSK